MACSTSSSRLRATSTWTGITRWRTPASSLGQAIGKALGDRAGIRRYADALVPLDEAPGASGDRRLGAPLSWHITSDIPKWQMLGDYDVFLTPEFFRALVQHAGLTAHMDLIRGDNPHHIVEAAFKAFARALESAICAGSASQGCSVHQGRAVIAVVDYGVNNLSSVVRALAAAGTRGQALGRIRRSCASRRPAGSARRGPLRTRLRNLVGARPTGRDPRRRRSRHARCSASVSDCSSCFRRARKPRRPRASACSRGG